MSEASIILAKQNFDRMLQEKRFSGNTTLSIISYITKVVENTSKQLQQVSGTKLTGREKYNLCCSITKYCIDQLLVQNLISPEQHSSVLEKFNDALLYSELVGGIISLAKEGLALTKGCCC